jgi:hypothetical protein
LNLHVFRHQILSLARLPIPPLARDLLGRSFQDIRQDRYVRPALLILAGAWKAGQFGKPRSGAVSLYISMARRLSHARQELKTVSCAPNADNTARSVRFVSIVGRSGARIDKKRKVAGWHPPLFAMRNLNVDKDGQCEFAKAGSIARRCWCLDAAVPSQGRG